MAYGPLLGNRPDSYGQRMNDVPAQPSGPLAAASLSVVQTTVSAPIADHSIRTFLYARLLAEHEGSGADLRLHHHRHGRARRAERRGYRDRAGVPGR